MKYFLLLALSLFIISCGPTQLENEDIQVHIFGETSVLNSINLGDSWEDAKKNAGDYWEVREDDEFNVYQFRKDLNSSYENIYITFKLHEGKIVGIGLDINSANIPQAAFMLHTVDLIDLYKRKFDLNLENRTEEIKTVNGQSYGYQLIQSFREEYSSIGVYCNKKS